MRLTAEGWAEDLSFLGGLKKPAQGRVFAAGRLGLGPSLVWPLLSGVGGCSFLLPHLALGWGAPLGPGRTGSYKRKTPPGATLLLRRPSSHLLCHCPRLGPSVAQALRLGRPHGGGGGFLSPPHPLPALLSCCRLFPLLPACSTVRRNKWLTEGPHSLGPPSPFLGPFREPDPSPLHPR